MAGRFEPPRPDEDPCIHWLSDGSCDRIGNCVCELEHVLREKRAGQPDSVPEVESKPGDRP